MKHLALPLALCLTGALLVGVLAHELGRRPSSTTPAPVTLERVRELSELVTLSVPVQQLIETELAGYTGATRCVLIARGEALISTDLAEARIELDRSRRTAHITLPPPRVLASTLDQGQSRIVLVARSGLWQIVPGEAGEAHLADRAMAEAQARMHRVAEESRRTERARTAIDALLTAWFERQGWEATITWSES